MLLTLMTVLSLAAAPPNWSCTDSFYGDGLCDCGCTVKDSDCSSLKFTVCERSGCTGGQVPWEDQNSSCMASTCGDGWKADNEACDDGNALASGGCNAGCSAVNAGYECGAGAAGCKVMGSPDAGSSGEEPGTSSPDGGSPHDGGGHGPADAGTSPGASADDDGESSGNGCSANPIGLSLGALLLPIWVRARGSRRR